MMKNELEEKAENAIVAELTFKPEISYKSRHISERSASRSSGKFIERE